MTSALTSSLSAILLLLIGLPITGNADFFVIPMASKIKNIVTVGKSGAQFADPVKALDSITDANATNRYVLLVGPGVYDVNEQIQLKNYVSLIGSGEKSTIFSGKTNKTDTEKNAALIAGASESMLKDFSVINTDQYFPTNFCVGVLFDGAINAVMRNVTVDVSQCEIFGFNIGIYNYYAFGLLIDNVTSTGNVQSDGSNLTIKNSRINVLPFEDNTISGAVRSSTSSIKIINSNIFSKLMFWSENSTVEAHRSTFGPGSIYKRNEPGSSYKFFHSTLQSTSPGPNRICTLCDDGIGSELNATCDVP